MATDFGVIVPGRDRHAIHAAVEALDEVERLEATLSIYREDSEISRINAAAGKSPVRVSRDVFAVLQRAQMLFQLTGGAFDITAGPLVECWGFSKRRGRKPTDAEIDEAKSRVGGDRLVLDEAARTALLADPGMSINLGGIGKGFALDCIAERLVESGVESFLIHGGRSSVLARGSETLSQAEADRDGQDAAGWRVAVEHPLRQGIRLGELRLVDAALSTSGSGKQFFHHRGQRMGHVLDPRTGRPAGDLLAITVICERASDADALATACFVEGYRRVVSYLQQPSPSGSEPAGRPGVEGADPPAWPLAAVAVRDDADRGRPGSIRAVQLGDIERLGFVPIAAVDQPLTAGE